MRDFPASLSAKPKVFDGAMGAVFFGKGVFRVSAPSGRVDVALQVLGITE
jgi:hypothetical protein